MHGFENQLSPSRRGPKLMASQVTPQVPYLAESYGFWGLNALISSSLFLLEKVAGSSCGHFMMILEDQNHFFFLRSKHLKIDTSIHSTE